MSDLVQKIADAVDAAWDAWSDNPYDERPFTVVQRDAIRQSLADAGGAVLWQYRVKLATGGHTAWHECSEAAAGDFARSEMCEVRTLYLYTDPDSGRVAELEAQLAAANNRLHEVSELCATTEQQLAESRDVVQQRDIRIADLSDQLAESREREARMREAALRVAMQYGLVGHMEMLDALGKATDKADDKEQTK